VVAFSSGNHAQAVALAGRLLGIPTTIVMPADAPAVKVAATRGYGAEVALYDRAKGESREQIAERIAREKGAAVVPPFDHAHVIAGQGTAAKELIEDVGPLDYLFVCCGGAGLLSGCAIAASHLSPGIKVVGVEPAAGDDAARSFRTRQLVQIDVPQTIADGARTQSLGALTFPLVLRHVHDIITVTDEELVAAMRFLWERMKLVVEPTGALATAGVLKGAIDVRDRRVGIILSGGNVDLKAIAALFA
jgi:threonine dehydratase